MTEMASGRGQGGIQQLLAAEQEAQRIVTAARNGTFTPIYILRLLLLFLPCFMFNHLIHVCILSNSQLLTL